MNNFHRGRRMYTKVTRINAMKDVNSVTARHSLRASEAELGQSVNTESSSSSMT